MVVLTEPEKEPLLISSRKKSSPRWRDGGTRLRLRLRLFPREGVLAVVLSLENDSPDSVGESKPERLSFSIQV